MKDLEKEQKPEVGINPINSEEIPVAPVNENELQDENGGTQAIDEKERMQPK